MDGKSLTDERVYWEINRETGELNSFDDELLYKGVHPGVNIAGY